VGGAILAFVAGLLSILSPCVLPLLPVIVGTAVSQHRFGPVALAAGLTLSFVTIGIFVATVGFAIGLDGDVFRLGAGLLLIAAGAVLVVPRLQVEAATAAGPVANWTEGRFGGFDPGGLKGQFGVGVLLGAVWSPCVGPTLGAVSILAARGENLAEVAMVMTCFGVGAAVPLLILGLLSRETMGKWRDRMIATGSRGKAILGGILLVVGLLIVSGLDKEAEAVLVASSPTWLTELTTAY